MRPSRRPAWLLGLALALSAAIGGAYVARATISHTITRQLYNGDGVTTTFAIPFSMVNVSNSEVRVVVRTASGYEHLQTLTTNYTISGGNVVFTAASTPASGSKVLIRRVKANTQTYDFIPGGTIPANTLEGVLDKLAMQIQELREIINRTLLMPETTSSSTIPLPEPSGSSVLAWNSAGTSVINVSQAEIAATNILGTANHVAVYSAAGVLSGEATLSKSRGGFAADMSAVTLPTSGTYLNNDNTVTVTNKSIDADTNTLTNIENADIKAAAAIALNKLAATTASRALVSDGSGFVSPSAVTSTELGYVSGVTSNIQTQLDGKLGGGLAGNRALVTDVAGNVGTSTVTDVEQGYLSGVTSAIQTQLDAKAALSQYPSNAGLTGALYSNVGVATVESALAQSRGGTGFSTYTQGDTIYASASNTLSKLAKGSAGQVLKMNAGATAPEWGAAGGAGGINFVPLDSSWAFTAPDNMNGDLTVGGWTAYADAAATSPVDMTGGSPNTTCVRNSTGASVLNGTGSLEMVLSSAGSRQGEGCSLLTYVPTAYRGQTVTFTFPFVLAGINVEDDIRVFAYDVTNSELITPYTSSKIVGTSGQLQASFATKTTTAQMRVGLHIARTSTGQLSVLFDDVSVGPGSVPKGIAGGNSWDCSSEIDFTSAGTVVTKNATCSRLGDRLKVQGDMIFAAVPGATFSVDMPTKYNVDYTKLKATSANKYIVGTHTRLQNTIGTVRETMFFDGTDLNSVFISRVSTGTTPVKLNSNTEAAINDGLHFEFEYPVSGWDANVSMAESSQFKISSYLATGSRVTATPTALGQYRSYLRTAGSQTLTETNGSPTFTPTAADGFRLYNGNAYTSADTNNEPTGYDVFIGKNKSWRFECYASTGRTGFIDTSQIQGGTDYGYTKNYDPSTGIFSIRGFRFNGSGTGHVSGFDSTNGNANDPYCDIVVSENAVAVGYQFPRSTVRLHTHNGEGSSSTKIMRFTTAVTNTGQDITYADSATLGGTFTINNPGIYSATTYCEANHGSTDNFTIGISLNSSELTTNIESITTADRLCASGSNGSYGDPTIFTCSWTGPLDPTNVLRVHGNGNDPATAAKCGVTVTKVSN